MTRMEIGIIVIAALIPIISLVILFPFRKKKKTKSEPSKPAETPVEQKEEKEKDKKDIPPVSGGISTASLDTSEFLGYLKDKSENISKPERKEDAFNMGELDDDLFSDMDFTKMRRRMKKKTIAQEIEDLSPELKAMLLTGVLDRKEF